MNQLLEAISRNAWWTESDLVSCEVQTMLATTELQMLDYLAREFPMSDAGMIVDAGSFLGGSTFALARGLSKNLGHQSNSGRIHAYDMFVAPNDVFSQGLIGNRPAGASVLDIFDRNIAPFEPLVTRHVGDFRDAGPPDGVIDILFIDIAKSWDLNQVVLSRFFPGMRAGHTIVVQQDHNDHSCPWVNVAMEHYAENFKYLTDDSSSRIYLYTKPIAQKDLLFDLRSLTVDRQVELVVQGAQRSRHPSHAHLSMVSAAWLIAENDPAQALVYLDGLSPQPWDSDPLYVDFVKTLIEQTTPGWHENYIKNYFSGSKELGS